MYRKLLRIMMGMRMANMHDLFECLWADYWH